MKLSESELEKACSQSKGRELKDLQVWQSENKNVRKIKQFVVQFQSESGDSETQENSEVKVNTKKIINPNTRNVMKNIIS